MYKLYMYLIEDFHAIEVMPDTIRHFTVSNRTPLQIPFTVHQTAEGSRRSRGYTTLYYSL